MNAVSTHWMSIGEERCTVNEDLPSKKIYNWL